MQLSSPPTLVPLPFADSGSKNVIPEAASPTPGLASLTTGFPPVTMTQIAAGGIPPAGQDMNGVLNLITQTTRWSQAGGPFAYNSGFATDANVNGYPQGATISRIDYTGQWISTVDNNTVNPDTVGTGWVPGYNYGTTAVTGLTNANVTLTPAQAAKSRITLAGTLTGNVQIIFPVWTKDWTIVNNTTGAFTVTCKTSTGTGIAIPQDASPTRVTGDGTNIAQLPENISPATQSQHAVQQVQAVGLAGDSRNLLAVLGTAGKSVSFTFDEAFVKSSLGGPGYVVTGTGGLTINTAGTGAGGMDTGTPVVTGYVAVYLIVNTSTGAKALLAQNEPSGGATTIYGGANMPSGYTASGLLSCLATDSSGNFKAFTQINRDIGIAQTTYVLSVNASPTLISIATAVPKTAKSCDGNLVVGSSSAGSNVGVVLQSTSSAGNSKTIAASAVLGAAGGQNSSFANLPILTAQSIWYTSSNTLGTASLITTVTNYRI